MSKEQSVLTGDHAKGNYPVLKTPSEILAPRPRLKDQAR